LKLSCEDMKVHLIDNLKIDNRKTAYSIAIGIVDCHPESIRRMPHFDRLSVTFTSIGLSDVGNISVTPIQAQGNNSKLKT